MLGMYIQSRYGEIATVEAIVSFNAQDLDRKFSMVGVDVKEIGLLVVAIFSGGLLSALFPLLSNLRRNPIRDMRDER